MATLRAIFPKAASLGVTVAAVIPGAASAWGEVRVDSATHDSIAFGDPSGMSMMMDPPESNVHAQPGVMVPLNEDEEWTNSKEREFTDLVTLKALNKATAADLERLNSLQRLRRREKNPMNPEEILFQFRKQQMAAKLRKDIEAYMSFTNATYSPQEGR